MIDKSPPILATRLLPIALCIAVTMSPVFAQSPATPSANEVEQAFQEVLSKAGSVEAHSKYASLLVRSGNFEGGIAALESLLLAPDAPASIRLELGVLYFRLGSYAISEAYLRAAIGDTRLAPQHKMQAEGLLREVLRRNQPSQVSGSLMLGVRTQSNPTAASDNDLVYYQGAAVARGKDAGPRSATDVHAWGTLNHSYDLQQQNEAAIASSLVLYANNYNSVSGGAGTNRPTDLAMLAGNTGIRFKPMRLTAPAFSLRPHVLFGSASANGNAYFTAGGWGIDGDYRASEVLLWGGAYENSRLVFSSRDDIANSAYLGGNRQSLKLNATVETTANQFLVAEWGYVDFDGNAPYTAYKGPQAKLAYSLVYPSPMSPTGRPWTTTLSVQAQQRDYRGADPTVDAARVRQDTEWRWSWINTMPISQDFSVQLQLDHTNTPSNIPNYTHTNTAGTLGLVWKY